MIGVKDVVTRKTISDANFIKLFVALHENGVVTCLEMNLLFDINTAISRASKNAAWKLLFANVIADGVLKRPGVLGIGQADYLITRMGGKVAGDPAKKKLCETILRRAKVPCSFQSFCADNDIFV